MRRIPFLILALALVFGMKVQAQDFIELAADESLPFEYVATDDFESEDPFAEEVDALEESESEEAFTPGSTIIGHVSDAHSWHMFDYYSKDGEEHAVAIPLPIILINNGHLDIFMSSKFHHGHADYKGYRLVGGGLEKEEIICVDEAGEPLLNEAGNVVKPLDFSITKVPAAIMIIVVMLIVIVMIAKKGYKVRENQAPKGLQSLVEMLVVFVRDDIVRPMIGEKHYEKYLPYMLTLFFFIFFSNCMGLIPFSPRCQCDRQYCHHCHAGPHHFLHHQSERQQALLD